MVEKNIAEKTLFDYSEVYADVMNVLLFHGKKIADAQEIEATDLCSHYKIEDNDRQEDTRDCLKIWKKDGEIAGYIGMEQKTKSDRYAPVRGIGYDGETFQMQLEQENEEPTDIAPVVTMFLHYGMKKWKYSRHLVDLVRGPKILKSFVNDYVANVFDIAWLTPDQVKMFESDYYVVADYFVQMRMNHKYEPSTKPIVHVDELLKLMTVLTKMDWQNEVIRRMHEEGRKITMADICAEIEKETEADRISGAYSGTGMKNNRLRRAGVFLHSRFQSKG